MAGAGHEVDAQKVPGASSKGQSEPFSVSQGETSPLQLSACPKVPAAGRGFTIGKSWDS